MHRHVPTTLSILPGYILRIYTLFWYTPRINSRRYPHLLWPFFKRESLAPYSSIHTLWFTLSAKESPASLPLPSCSTIVDRMRLIAIDIARSALDKSQNLRSFSNAMVIEVLKSSLKKMKRMASRPSSSSILTSKWWMCLFKCEFI